MTELDLAHEIASGRLASPLELARDLWLVNLRITGTGQAFRAGLDEHVWRDPSLYLTGEFLARCNGLPVCIGHPAGLRLDAREYAQRSTGAVMLPYVKGDEVWAVARLVAKDDMIEAISRASTSPSVVMRKGTEIDLGNGEHVLIEGEPMLLDHVAIVPAEPGGVWDLGGRAGRGVDDGEASMADETEDNKETEEGGELDRVLDALAGIGKRLDGIDKRMDALERGRDGDGADHEQEDGVAQQLAADGARGARRRHNDGKARRDDDRDEDRLGEAQYRADVAAVLWGKRADPPMMGETVRSYRIRHLQRHQKFSPDYRLVDLKTVTDPVVFDAIEKAIFADSAKAAIDNDSQPHGVLREVRRLDASNRPIIEFVGDVNAALAPFRYPTMRVRAFNKNPDAIWG